MSINFFSRRISSYNCSISSKTLLIVTIISLVFLGFGNLSCVSDVDPGQWASGRIMRMNVKKVERLPSISYQDKGSTYIVQPSDSQLELVLVHITLVNHRSATVSMFVDDKSAELTGTGGKAYKPIDPFIQRVASSDLNDLPLNVSPFIWGVSEFPKDFKINGWLIFEIPKGAPLRGFRWEQVDVLSVYVLEKSD
jgi:hypothetical protein